MSLTWTQTVTAKDLMSKTVRQKAFNYFVDGHLLITYFEGDDHLLYMIFEISAIQIIYKLMTKITSMNGWADRHKLREKNSKAKLMVRA